MYEAGTVRLNKGSRGSVGASILGSTNDSSRLTDWRQLRSLPLALLIPAVATVLLVVLVIFRVLTGSFGIATAILIGASPIALATVGQLFASEMQNKREIEAKLREQKAQVYEGFLAFWLDLFLPENRQRVKAG